MAGTVRLVNPSRGLVVKQNPEALQQLADIFETTAKKIREVGVEGPESATVNGPSTSQALAATKRNPSGTKAALQDQLEQKTEQLDDLRANLADAVETIQDVSAVVADLGTRLAELSEESESSDSN